MRKLNPFERKRLALEAFMSERTVQKAYVSPARIRESTRLRLVRAAERLGIEPPTAVAGSERMV
jgi:DNA-binding LacI/PurR family transcriptional regulator